MAHVGQKLGFGAVRLMRLFVAIDLPEGMPKEIFNDLKYVWVSGQQLKISRLGKETKRTKSASHTRAKAKGPRKEKARRKKTSKKKVRRKTRQQQTHP